LLCIPATLVRRRRNDRRGGRWKSRPLSSGCTLLVVERRFPVTHSALDATKTGCRPTGSGVLFSECSRPPAGSGIVERKSGSPPTGSGTVQGKSGSPPTGSGTVQGKSGSRPTGSGIV
jgi:hypothetical protein